MRLRFILFFLLLVAVPLALIAWVGAMLLRQEREQARASWMAAIEERLAIADNLLAEEMSRLGNDFDDLLKGTTLDGPSLHELPRTQPLVRQAFLLDARGHLLLPNRNGVTQGEEGAFVRRTESVWESGVRFGSTSTLARKESDQAPPQQAGIASSAMPQQRQETFYKKADVRPSVKAQAKDSVREPAVKSSGWHVWFYGSGPQMLFWQERDDGRVAGVEVEMAALISLWVNRLSGADAPNAPGLMQLTSSDGKDILHQWGAAGGEEVVAPVAQRDCSTPLGMWRLAYRPARDEAPRSHRLPVVLAAAGAGVALLALAFLFLRESTREMREARRRVSFVNQVSHELKTPLTNIRLYAEMAQQRVAASGDVEATRHLGVVEAETSRLSRLIHNVLTFARQQRDQLTVHHATASLDEVTRRVVDLWRPGLEGKGFRVECSLAAAQPFEFDADAVEQIIGNLLSNVEKYAGGGHWVRIATDCDGVNARLMVEDRGPGIPARMREQVFAPFVRVRGDLTEGASGTGIGLSISKHLAELHGGSLLLEDAAPGGSRFVLILPVKRPS